jgi:ABC-type antimicrobial peptide transport system permease subunit
MFSFGYAWSELTRRAGRTIVTALGLALGVGMVVGIIGVSEGLSTSQNRALSPLSSVGTDIVVTRTVAPTTVSSSSSSSSAGSSGGAHGSNPLSQGAAFFGGPEGKALSQLDTADDAALLSANSSVLTDLSKLGPPGTQFTHDFFLPGTLITFPQKAVNVVSGVKGVKAAVAALSMQAEHETGTVPSITATVVTPAQTINTLESVPPLTPAQGSQIAQCLFSDPNFSAALSRGGGGAGLLSDSGLAPILQKCLPASYQQFVSQVVVPAATISQVVNPPSTDINTSSYTVAGVDPRHPALGLVTEAQVTKGHWFGAHPADQVLLSTAYASTKSIKVGQQLPIDGTTFTVAGLVNPTASGATADLYFDLTTLQSLASTPTQVNEVLVQVAHSSQVNVVVKRIRRLLPGAQVLADDSLDSTVTGSLANAHTIASDFGGAVALIILVAAFVIAALLTLSSVSKRVREIGTLRALGWSRGRVVGQIVAETTMIGVLGAALGLLVGVAVCALIGAFGPSLSAVSASNSIGASVASGLFHQSTRTSAKLLIPLTAPVHGSTLLLGVGFSVVGGLVAGLAGGWRAARLAPASALADLG